MENPESFKIHAVAVSCREHMRNLLVVADCDDYCLKEFLPVRDVRHFKDRFEQWAGNLGALQHSESPKSLDHRLRDNPMIKNIVLSTIHELDVSVQAGATTEVPLLI